MKTNFQIYVVALISCLIGAAISKSQIQTADANKIAKVVKETYLHGCLSQVSYKQSNHFFNPMEEFLKESVRKECETRANAISLSVSEKAIGIKETNGSFVLSTILEKHPLVIPDIMGREKSQQDDQMASVSVQI